MAIYSGLNEHVPCFLDGEYWNTLNVRRRATTFFLPEGFEKITITKRSKTPRKPLTEEQRQRMREKQEARRKQEQQARRTARERS